MNVSKQKSIRAAIVGGLIPLLIYTLIEEYYGTLWGLVTGMAFGAAEILYEKLSYGKVGGITWLGNGMILILGGVSLFTQEGFWFKMQPAIIEAFTALFLIGSYIRQKPLLILLAEKQNLFSKLDPARAELIKHHFALLTVRIGIFFMLHAGLATWAALYWSTRAWVLLKGIGFTLSMVLYLGIEIWLIRQKAIAR